LPWLIVVLDDIGDIVKATRDKGEDLEPIVASLSSGGRASGIHVILVTQHPSDPIIEKLIRRFVPTRVAFRLPETSDGFITEANDEHRLPGLGRFLFVGPGKTHPVRLQAAFVPSDDIDRVTSWYEAIVRL